MRESCEKVKLREAFPTPKAYLDCLAYIQFLVDSGSFQFEFKSCDTDKVKDENGCWANDVIRHVIKCKIAGSALLALRLHTAEAEVSERGNDEFPPGGAGAEGACGAARTGTPKRPACRA